MQSADGVAVGVPSELADLHGVPLQEMAVGAPTAVERAVQRVLPESAEGAALVGAASFGSCI